jgi:hypothetical protein
MALPVQVCLSEIQMQPAETDLQLHAFEETSPSWRYQRNLGLSYGLIRLRYRSANRI